MPKINDPDHDTDGGRRASMCACPAPTTLADQLAGNLGVNMPTGPDGAPVDIPVHYPIGGNAGIDNDNDSDDFGWGPYQQSGAITSSSGP
jgi:hypothetical protein